MEGGLLTASTASVAASAQSVAAEAEKTTVRKVDCILRSSCRVNAASHAGVTGSLDSGQPPEPPGRVNRIGGGQRHVEVVVPTDHVEHTRLGSGWERFCDRERRPPHPR